MEPNEAMTNEVMETAKEEITEVASKGDYKLAVGFGVGIIAGMAICKLAKPVIGWVKSMRKDKDVVDGDYREVEPAEEVNEEPEEETE